jgi:hypothetical protein
MTDLAERGATCRAAADPPLEYREQPRLILIEFQNER